MRNCPPPSQKESGTNRSPFMTEKREPPFCSLKENRWFLELIRTTRQNVWLHDSMGTFTNGGMVTFLDEKNDQAQKAVQIRVVLGRGLGMFVRMHGGSILIDHKGWVGNPGVHRELSDTILVPLWATSHPLLFASLSSHHASSTVKHAIEWWRNASDIRMC
eukprot:scaffold2636_cov340-Pavlova_lutheri.AAC.104